MGCLGPVALAARLPRPSRRKAWRVLCTVPMAHPKKGAISDGRWPRALASRIWDRRKVNASGDRRPASSSRFSSADRGRTNRGGFTADPPTPTTFLLWGRERPRAGSLAHGVEF